MGLLTAIGDAWGARRASSEIERTLSPLVGGMVARLGGVPPHAWRDPYVVGFLVALITLLAGLHRRLGQQALGFVQLDCWQRLTGLRDPGFGERVCLLSASGDAGFAQGCRDAHNYLARRRETGTLDIGAPRSDPLAAHAGTRGEASGGADYVWSCTIESQLAALLGCIVVSEAAAVLPHDLHRQV